MSMVVADITVFSEFSFVLCVEGPSMSVRASRPRLPVAARRSTVRIHRRTSVRAPVTDSPRAASFSACQTVRPSRMFTYGHAWELGKRVQ